MSMNTPCDLHERRDDRHVLRWPLPGTTENPADFLRTGDPPDLLKGDALPITWLRAGPALTRRKSQTTGQMRESCAMETADRLPVIICDVDGTLCDVRSIRHYVERPDDAERFRANFALFHSSSEECPAFPDALKLVKDLERAGYGVVIVTAREARWVEVTERWLNRHGVRRVELITRPALDYRSDAVVKAEICADIQTRYAPCLAIDDRDDILAVWAAAAIPTVKVGDAGDLSPVTWPGSATDQRITAAVEGIIESRSPYSSPTGGRPARSANRAQQPL